MAGRSKKSRLPVIDLQDEPMSLSVTQDAITKRLAFSHVPERLLPRLFEAFGQRAVDAALTPDEVAAKYWRDLPLTTRSKVRHRELFESGELRSRVKALQAQGKTGKTGRYFMAAVSRADEAILGRSGGIYFVCYKGCHFCHYRDFPDEPIDAVGLAARMLALEKAGADNVQFLSPTAYTPMIVEALLLADEEGFKLPIVHKSEGEDASQDLALLDGIVDMYLPDAKFILQENAENIGLPPNYAKRMQACIREMVRQVGPLTRRAGPIALQGGGVFVRHLLMPGLVEDAKAVLEFVASIDRDQPMRLMTNYEPMHDAAEHPIISRRISPEEVREVAEHAKALKLTRVLVG
jgi:putative pyruvate formate lyase activating enzyme